MYESGRRKRIWTSGTDRIVWTIYFDPMAVRYGLFTKGMNIAPEW